MKHSLGRIISLCAATVAALTLFSCSSSEKGTRFDAELLSGKWLSGTEYYFFSSTGTGYTWDSAEVDESEAQSFTWSLSGSTLTLKHQMSISTAEITKTYTVTELTSSTLKFKDSYKTFSYTKAS